MKNIAERRGGPLLRLVCSSLQPVLPRLRISSVKIGVGGAVGGAASSFYFFLKSAVKKHRDQVQLVEKNNFSCRGLSSSESRRRFLFLLQRGNLFVSSTLSALIYFLISPFRHLFSFLPLSLPTSCYLRSSLREIYTVDIRCSATQCCCCCRLGGR